MKNKYRKNVYDHHIQFSFDQAMTVLKQDTLLQELLLSHFHFHQVQLAEFQKMIESIDLLEGTTLAFRGERNLVNMWFDQIAAGTAKPASDGEMFVDPGWFVDLNRYHINRIITKNLLARIDVKKHRVSMQGVPTAGEEMEQLTNVPFAWRYTFTTMLIPAYDKITLKMTSAQAGLDQVMVAAALERHRLMC